MKKKKKEYRPRLKADELDALNNYRRLKEEAEANGLDPRSVKQAWIKTDEASLFVKNPNFKTVEELKVESLFNDIVKECKNYSPKYPTIKRKQSKNSHCLVVDPADIHIGKLCSKFEVGKDYNSQIAVKRVLSGVQGLLDKSSGFSIDKIIFIAGNDILHTDNPKRQTTSGTPQDTDGMWYDNFLVAKQLYIDLIEMLMQVADVHFIFNPSNHDYQSGFFLAQLIESHFRLSKNVTFDCSISHRKYTLYGNSLIGTTHGDGAKEKDLGNLMSIEAKELWVKSEHRYYYTHHIHHKTAKDYINVTVESLRSPSVSDSWHNRNGYISPEAVEAFIHSKENGQIARLTHLF